MNGDDVKWELRARRLRLTMLRGDNVATVVMVGGEAGK